MDGFDVMVFSERASHGIDFTGGMEHCVVWVDGRDPGCDDVDEGRASRARYTPEIDTHQWIRLRWFHPKWPCLGTRQSGSSH